MFLNAHRPTDIARQRAPRPAPCLQQELHTLVVLVTTLTVCVYVIPPLLLLLMMITMMGKRDLCKLYPTSCLMNNQPWVQAMNAHKYIHI